jgi:hypothetical protein
MRKGVEVLAEEHLRPPPGGPVLKSAERNPLRLLHLKAANGWDRKYQSVVTEGTRMRNLRLATVSPLLLAALLPLSMAWSQESSKLTARELFYTPLKKTSKPETSSAPKAVATPQRPAQVAAAEKAEPDRPQEMRRSTPERSTTPSGVSVIAASNTSLGPLGLRYSFLRYDSSGDAEEVDADHVFHSGDRMKIRLETNSDGFLYIVMKGTSGSWRVMFPSKEYGNGDNRVRAGQVYELPRNTRFAFTGKPGAERIFLVLSRRVVPDLEELIYDLHGRPEPAGDERLAPVTTSEPPKTLLASLGTVDDALIGRLRNAVYARDLVFEKVDEKTPGDRKEKAVYVVNKSTAADARLVADISLQHE